MPPVDKSVNIFKPCRVTSLTHNHTHFQVFEDALDDVVEATEINISALNNNIKPRKSFKLKSRKSAKHEKTDDISEDVSLDQGLAEAQEAIDMFFNNQFEESREIAQKQ